VCLCLCCSQCLVYCLAQPERLGVTWICFCYHYETWARTSPFQGPACLPPYHPSLVQGVCSRSLLGGTACMCVCVCMNKAYAHGHFCAAMHACICWECVFLHEQGVCSRSLLRVDACMCLRVCTYQVHAHIHSCKPMHVCLYVCA
jgi:hypothetical protein